MPLPPYAKLRVAVNGGAPQTGALTLAASDSIQFSAESTVGWTSAPRWELYGYPPGWTAPAGWSTDASGVIYNTAVVPPAFTLPSVGGIWGKWLPRLIVNNSSIDPDTGAGTPIPKLVDAATAFQIASPLGLKDLAQYEDTQFGPNWAKDHQVNLRTLDSAIGALQAGQGGAAIASGTITSGKVVVSVPSQPTKVQQFTIAAMLAGAQIRGIATSSATNGLSVTYGPAGSVVGNAVTGLGASTPGARVGVLTDGSLSALTRSFGGFEAGSTDSSGNVSVAPISHVKQASMQPYNPVAYGAIPNDSSGPVQHSNLIAFNTMMGDIRRNSPGGHKVVIHDTFYLEDSWYIDSPISMDTIGGGGFSGGTGKLIFPQGTEGIIIMYPSLAANLSPAAGQGVRLHDLGVNTATDPAIIPLWKPGTLYARNALVRAPGDPRYVFRATTIVSGTSGGTIPAAFASPEFTTPQRWSPGATYAVGRFLFPNRASAQYGLVAYQVTSSNGNTTPGTLGVAGTSQPSFPGVAGTVTTGQLVLTGVAFNTVAGGLQAKLAIVDNTVTWIPEALSGVLANAIFNIDCMTIGGFLCDGLSCYGDGAWSLVDFSRASNVTIGSCAGGISTRGGDANALHFQDCTVTVVGASAQGTPLPGQIGHAFNDAGQAGCTWVNCCVETCTGRAFINSTSGTSTFINPVSDGNYLANRFLNASIVHGGGDNAAVWDNSTSIAGARSRMGTSQQYVGVDYAGQIRLFAGFSAQDGKTLYPISSASESGGDYMIGWRYDNFIEGWWTNALIGGPSTIRILNAISGTQSKTDGPANQWNWVGQFEGTPQHRVHVGVSREAGTDKWVRYGKRFLGDVYRANEFAIAGDWTHKIAAGTGYIGTSTWSAGATQVPYDPALNVPADTMIGVNGWPYQCVKGGVSGGANPFTAPTGAIGPSPLNGDALNCIMWVANKNVRPGDLFFGVTHPDPATAVVSYFQVDVAEWAVTATIGVNEPRTPLCPTTGANKDVYVPAVEPYSAAAVYEVGMLVQPFNRVGTKAYQLISVTGPDGLVDWAGGISTTLAAGTEPVWDTVTGNLSTSGNGYVFKTVVLQTGATQPTWGALPDLISVHPGPSTFGYKDGNFHWKKVQLNTGGVEPTWVRTSVGSITASPTIPTFSYKKLGTFPDNALFADGTALWMGVGIGLNWNVTNKVEDPVINYEVRARYREGATPSGIEAIPKTRLDRNRSYTTTTNATPAVIDSYVLPDNATTLIECKITAVSGANSAGYTLLGVYNRNAGTITLVSTVDKVAKEAAALAAADVSLVINSANIDVTVTGVAATNISWSCVRIQVEGLT